MENNRKVWSAVVGGRSIGSDFGTASDAFDAAIASPRFSCDCSNSEILSSFYEKVKDIEASETLVTVGNIQLLPILE